MVRFKKIYSFVIPKYRNNKLYEFSTCSIYKLITCKLNYHAGICVIIEDPYGEMLNICTSAALKKYYRKDTSSIDTSMATANHCIYDYS